ncbi:hypothetical protein JYT83_00370 [bacterium AH-315-F18]|nr:hypothetical protein [bacterium AH-315-F18]
MHWFGWDSKTLGTLLLVSGLLTVVPLGLLFLFRKSGVWKWLFLLPLMIAPIPGLLLHPKMSKERIIVTDTYVHCPNDIPEYDYKFFFKDIDYVEVKMIALEHSDILGKDTFWYFHNQDGRVAKINLSDLWTKHELQVSELMKKKGVKFKR